MSNTPPVAKELGQLLERYWQRFFEKGVLDEVQLALVESAKEKLDKVWLASDFVAEQCIKDPLLLVELLGSGDFERSFCAAQYQCELAGIVAEISSQPMLARALRQFRQREMVRLIWRDVLQQASLEEVVRSLSDLADVCLMVARDTLHGWLEAKHGSPRSDDGVDQQLVVIAMGKLGARELNLSSDIDLIFTYSQRGECVGGGCVGGDRVGNVSGLSNQEFFVLLGQQLIQTLDQVTEDGFVFRVDMRLRPYGQSGALVLSYDALESYYQGQGREWERYAFVKARCVSLQAEPDQELMTRLQPFVYRRYVDYGAIESLRDMKALINREVRRRGVSQNIKLGPGGIREIEFIVQAVQLINGGRDRRLQTSNLLSVLAVLEQGGYYPALTVQALAQAYRFLRTLEHRIQGLRDQQTQNLPGDETDRLRVANAMLFGSWDELILQLDEYRAAVREHFDLLISKEQSGHDQAGLADSDMTAIWDLSQPREQLLGILLALSISKPDAEGLVLEVEKLKASKQLQRSHAVGLQRLDQLMPALLGWVAAGDSPLQTLVRIVPLLYQVLRRSAYLVLLLENEVALKHLVALCSASPWIADQLASQPLLLDELIDANSLFSHPDLDALKDELRQQLLRIPNDDLEQQMECLRHFKKGHVLRVAATEVSAFRPLMRVSDYLTDIAEATLSVVADIAWQQMVDKYGYPTTSEGRVQDRPFLIIAYGKLAGYELSYSSDLDLVFVYESPSNLCTDGERSIGNTVFFTRLVQRIIHVLTSNTASGELYEVDSRLRPSGAAGLLASSFVAFQSYQLEKAWTWEHQALVRSRVVMGSAALNEKFCGLRKQVLTQQRDPQTLREEVVSMREKMRGHLDTPAEGLFDLKQGSGGIVDIEFMVQYSVLRWAHQTPELLVYADNIRILEMMLEYELISLEDSECLSRAYLRYRSLIHRAALQNQKGQLSEQAFEASRQNVREIWQRLLGDS